MVRLLFNSDDLGISPQVNAAILKGHKEGLLSSASLMVTGSAFGEAVQLSRMTPSLKVGLHLALSEALPALPPNEVNEIVGPNGRFYSDPAKIGIKLALSRNAKAQVKNEVRRQFELFADTQLPREHVDGHHHLHMHPFIFDEVIFWAAKMGFKRVRVAKEFGNPFPPRRDLKEFGVKAVRHLIFNALAKRNGRMVDPTVFPARCDGVLGLWETGRMSEDYLLKALPHLTNGNWEIYFHLGAARSEEENEAVTSLKVRQLLEQLKIQLL